MSGRTPALAIALVTLFSIADARAQFVTLFNFESPAQTTSGLVDGGDGFYYGTTPRGGVNGRGDVYRIDLATGVRSTVASFDGDNGSFPNGEVFVTSRYLYGTTYLGGVYDLGTIYQVDRQTNVIETIASFGTSTDQFNGAYPRAGLVMFGSDLYGTTYDGGERNVGGTIFKINPETRQLTTLGSFEAFGKSTGANPTAPLLVRGSLLYGTTRSLALGVSSAGAVYRFDPATRQITQLAVLDGVANSALVSVGNFLYGTTTASRSGSGTIFKVDLATGAATTEFTFDLDVGANPYGPLSYDGKYLYGTTGSSDRRGWGTVFRFDPSDKTLTVLAVFTRSNGAYPRSPLLMKDGSLFGTTFGGGFNDGGTIFSVDLSTKTLSDISFFNDATTGATPAASLLLDGQTVYGTTAEGGASGLGTIFRFDLGSGELTSRASFDFRTGGYPFAGLVAKDGTYYGTTQTNGVDAAGSFKNNGTIYSFEPSNDRLSAVYAFDGQGANGARPQAELLSVGSLLFGTALGSRNGGTVFQFDPRSGSVVPLKTFSTLTPSDGLSPTAPLLFYQGMLYGTTQAPSQGEVFQIDLSSNAFAVVSRFSPFNSDGRTPSSGLVECGGFLYGVTQTGGDYGLGTLFRVDPVTRTRNTVASFRGATGEQPWVNGRLSTNGRRVFGVAGYGGVGARPYSSRLGPGGHGVVFQYDPATNVLSSLHSFALKDGDAPVGALLVVGNDLYGTTEYGGLRGGGTLFRIAIPLVVPRIVSVQPVSAGRGTTITIKGDGFAPGMTVLIDGAPSSTVFFVDAQTIQAVVPEGGTGTGQIVVVDRDGQATAFNGFTVSAAAAVPTLSNLSLTLLGAILVALALTAIRIG